MTNPCAECTRRCCHHYVVTVTGYDVWVIANGLRLAPEQFLVTVPQKPSARTFRLDGSERMYDIALDKAKARTREKPCVFWLGLPGGGGRCGIYPFRPFVCQTYPAMLNGGDPARREDVLCPAEAWRDGSLQMPAWRERLYRMQVEFDIYGLVVARWNYHVTHAARPDRLTPLAYYTYLMNFYARLAPLRARMTQGDGAALTTHWAASALAGVSPLVQAVPDLAAWDPLFEGIRAIAERFFPDDRREETPAA